MNEYDPNRWECCDQRLPSRFYFCPICGTAIPKRDDTPIEIEKRQQLANLRGARTRFNSLKTDILKLESMREFERIEFDERCYPWTTWQKSLASHKEELEKVKKRAFLA